MPPSPSSPEARLDALAAAYLQPWSSSGVSQALVDEAHLKWADYRDRQWGSYVPLGTSHNRLLRVNVIGNKLYFYTCAGRHSKNRLARQRAALELLQTVLDAHAVPDVDFVLGISDRPTIPRAATASRAPPPLAFAYVATAAHHSVPWPSVSFAPRRWRQLYDGGAGAAAPPLSARRQRALWRGSCNSLCDEKAGGCSWPKDRALLSRAALLHAASRCPAKTDVGLTASHHNCPRSFSRVTGPLPLAQWSRYAYLLHVDGNGFSGRLEELLTLGGVILKQQSPFDAWYYPLLQPGTHYVPFSLTGANASGAPELCDALRALHADAARAERLAAAARNFTAAYLAPERVRYYVAALLRRYASLQRFTPRRHPLAVPFDAAEAPRSANQTATARMVGCPPGDAKCCRRHPKACRPK